MADADLPLQPGDIIAGKYRVDGLLGKGGMGSVFQATNTAIGRRVAIKVLAANVADRDDVKQRFELEARAAAVIGHPGIVDVLDMGETEEGEPFIVMEYLEGATLKGVFKRIGGFTPAQAAAVICPVLDALAAAHTAGVVHRDVKPANIFVCTKPTQTIKLLDFGISRFGKSTGLTITGTAVGTPKYMAPEQVLGEKDLGPEADLYSVGAVMYHLLTGRPPHDADSDMATLARILTDVHSPLHTVRPDLPEELCQVVDALLAKDKAQRPKDAAVVRARILQLVPRPDTESIYAAAIKATRVVATSNTPSPTSGTNGRPRSRPSAPGTRRGSQDDAARLAEATGSKTSPVLIALAALGILAGIGGAVFALKKDPAPPLPPIEPPRVAVVQPPAAPATYTTELSADPPAARFTVDGETMDCNPCRVTRPTGTKAQAKVSAPDYVSAEFTLYFDKNRDQHFTLVAVPVPVAVAAPVDAGKPLKAAPGPKHPGPSGLNVDERNPYQ